MASIFDTAMGLFSETQGISLSKDQPAKPKKDLFKLEVQKVFRREGGYVNDPADSGGETIYGISKRANPEAWAKGRPSLKDAENIYRRNYWEAVKGDYLPPKVAAVLFDHAVLSGPGAAIEDLNRALGKHGGGIDENIVKSAWSADHEKLATDLTAKRLERFDRIVARHPEKAKFFPGWSHRAVSALSEAGVENDMLKEYTVIKSNKSSLLSDRPSGMITARQQNARNRRLNHAIKRVEIYQGRALLEEKRQADEITKHRND